MHRKILGICTALMALAILPAAASAATTATDAGGTLPVNAKIKAIGSTVSKFATSSGTVECNENYMTGSIHANSNGRVFGTITDASFDSNLTAQATDCKFGANNTVRVTIPELVGQGGTKHWCLENVANTDNFNLFGKNCTAEGNGTLTFLLDLTGVASCPYERSAAVSGTFTTPGAGTASTLSVTSEPVFTREGTNILCPSEGKITQMEFKLYTDTDGVTTAAERTTNWNTAANTNDPVWISP